MHSVICICKLNIGQNNTAVKDATGNGGGREGIFKGAIIRIVCKIQRYPVRIHYVTRTCWSRWSGSSGRSGIPFAAADKGHNDDRSYCEETFNMFHLKIFLYD